MMDKTCFGCELASRVSEVKLLLIRELIFSMSNQASSRIILLLMHAKVSTLPHQSSAIYNFL
jgi:hypothetical protein